MNCQKPVLRRLKTVATQSLDSQSQALEAQPQTEPFAEHPPGLARYHIELCRAYKLYNEPVQYVFHIQTTTGCWRIHRRYSEISEFRDQLFRFSKKAAGKCTGECQVLQNLKNVDFPTKFHFPRRPTQAFVKTRGYQLDEFISRILSIYQRAKPCNSQVCKHIRSQVSELIKSFLGISRNDEDGSSTSNSFNTCDCEGDNARSNNVELYFPFK